MKANIHPGKIAEGNEELQWQSAGQSEWIECLFQVGFPPGLVDSCHFMFLLLPFCMLSPAAHGDQYSQSKTWYLRRVEETLLVLFWNSRGEYYVEVNHDSSCTNSSPLPE